MIVYLLIRTDLGMSPGKMIAQGAHAFRNLAILNPRWFEEGRRLVTLKASTKEIERAKLIKGASLQYDAGFTEVDAETLTAIALPPMPKNNRPPWLKRMRLL